VGSRASLVSSPEMPGGGLAVAEAVSNVGIKVRHLIFPNLLLLSIELNFDFNLDSSYASLPAL
jgi:hypothetical protein